MSLRFIKNRLADFGMIKPAEFLSHIFCMLYWSYERISCFASNHLDQN